MEEKQKVAPHEMGADPIYKLNGKVICMDKDQKGPQEKDACSVYKLNGEKPEVLDLYSGMGGLSLGFIAAGAKVIGLDINPSAVSTYNMNLRRFQSEARKIDVLKWTPEGEYDIIIGGPPCQPFSGMNTKRIGQDHPLFPTFPKFFDIILALKPKAFLMENVPGLLFSRNRPYLREQLSRVEGHYNIKVKLIDASDYGVPQRRRRVFVMGIRRDVGDPEFPAPTHRKEKITAGDAIEDLLKGWDGGKREKAWRVDDVWLMKHKPIRLDMPSPTIVSHIGKNVGRPEVMIGDQNGFRRLTVRECLRLQSFPDWWKFPLIGRTMEYKLVGEAVPPLLAYKLARKIFEIIGKKVEENRGIWRLPYAEKALGGMIC